MTKQKIGRRRLILSHTSQPRLLITMVAIVGLVAVTMMVFVYVDYNMQLDERFPGFSTIQPVILSALVLINVAAVILSLILLVLFTHSVVGPIYNIRRILRGVAQGDLSERIQFRKRDFLQEISTDGNLALDHLRQEIGDMQQLSEQVVTFLEESKAAGEQPEGREKALEDAREMRDRLCKFTLEKGED